MAIQGTDGLLNMSNPHCFAYSLISLLVISYTAKGERQHLNLKESDMNYVDLLKVLKAFDVRGALVCESPNIEGDAKLLKETYLSL